MGFAIDNTEAELLPDQRLDGWRVDANNERDAALGDLGFAESTPR